jgi:hypothetical protein
MAQFLGAVSTNWFSSGEILLDDGNLSSQALLQQKFEMHASDMALQL